jgi:hypothetical protein
MTKVLSAGGVQITWRGADDDPQVDDRLAVVEQAFNLVHNKGTDQIRHALQALSPLDVRPNIQLGQSGIAQEGGAEASWEPMGRGGTPFMKIGLKMFVRNKKVESKTPGLQVKGGMGEGAGRGVADHVYDDHRKSRFNPSRWSMGSAAYQKQKAMAKGAAVIVHEIGHFIHEQVARDQFWGMKATRDPMSIAVPMEIASQVSAYLLANNWLEFVAEVFTGLMYNKTYSAGVMAKYTEYGGPAVGA